MIKKSTSLTLYLIFDAVLFLLCIIGIYHFSEKATLPFNVEYKGDGLLITELLTENSDIQINDKSVVLHYGGKMRASFILLDGKLVQIILFAPK